MYAQDKLDQIILKNFGPGIFVEAGGSDPECQNNTYLLEQNGWSGLIVEPNTRVNQKYQELRPNSILENYVLVNNDYLEHTINCDLSADMMGGVDNIHHLANWSPSPYPCIQLQKLLDKHVISEITFLSLDVEGYEKNVLMGIDFSKTFIHSMVIECHPKDGIMESFNFLETMGFHRKFAINGHEFFINRQSPAINTFTICV